MRFLTFILIFLSGLASVYAQEANKPLPPDVEFKGLLSQANILLMKGDTEKAMSCLMSALKVNPKSSVCNFELARIFMESRTWTPRSRMECRLTTSIPKTAGTQILSERYMRR